MTWDEFRKRWEEYQQERDEHMKKEDKNGYKLLCSKD